MFVDFNKVFNQKPQTELRIPDAMVEHLNSTLPDGVRYVADDNGNCHIDFENDSITIGGLIFKPTDEHKKVLGKNFTHDDVLKYSYNAQKPIPLEFKKFGYITLNGEEFPIERLSFKPYNPIKFISGTFFMHPHPFPKPIKLAVGCEKYSYELFFNRIPNESIDIISFESEKEKPLYIKYSLNETTEILSFSISFNLSYAKTILEIVKATSIYNAFVDGKGYLNGHPLLADVNKTKIKKYDVDSIAFWEKVLQIEKILNVQFNPPQEDVDYETLYLVETLYQNLIQKVPVRKNKKLNSVDGNWDKADEKTIRESIGKPLYFEFQATTHCSLFDVDFDLPCTVGIFNAKISDYSKKKGKASLLLENESEEKQMYVSSQIFLTQESLQEYLSKNVNDRITKFHNAKTAQEYIKH